MGLKENINAVKEEIGTEEKFLESVIKSERFFKKYKFPIIAAVIILIVGGATYAVMQMQAEKSLKVSNEAYLTLMKDPQNTEALKKLEQNNERLLKFFEFQRALENGDKAKLEELAAYKKDPVISDLASYQLKGKDAESTLLEGFEALQEGYEFLKAGSIDKANNSFTQIGLDSPLNNIVKSLQHYQGNK